MRRYHFIQADVFTEVIFGGNPVAIFPDAEGLSDIEMQKIAREMNLSETTFVLPPTDPRADVRVRFFTPTAELPFAGHPTIGTHVVLAQLGRYPISGPVTRIWQQVGIGTLPVDLITDGDGKTNRAVMTQGEARHGEVFEDRDTIARALGLTPADLHPDLPAQVFSTGLPGLIIPLASSTLSGGSTWISARLTRCRRQASPARRCSRWRRRQGTTSTCATSTAAGVFEDPATGSMAGRSARTAGARRVRVRREALHHAHGRRAGSR